jgi:Flp pilus assembly protein TadD
LRVRIRRLVPLLLLVLVASPAMSVADDTPSRWDAARARIAASVVTVEVTDASGAQVDQGTGFFVSKDGTVATSRHLFRRAAGATVVLHDGTRREATGVRGADPVNDLVLLTVAEPPEATVAWGATKALSAGSPLGMLGSARGVPQTFTEGEFVKHTNALGVVGFIETTVAMDHGSSGSPLFDPEGRVVGLAAARLDWANPSGLSIPVERVRALLYATAMSGEVRPFGTAATFLDASEWAVQTSAEMGAATAAASAGDDAGLVTAMKAVVAKYPRSALALYGLGSAQSQAGDDASAVTTLRKARALAPSYLEVASDLAAALERLGRHEEAVAAYRKSIELEPRDLTQWFGLGMALVGARDFGSAITALERVVEKVPDKPEVWAWLGTAYVGAERLDDARAVVDRLRPDHPDVADRLTEEIARHAK